MIFENEIGYHGEPFDEYRGSIRKIRIGNTQIMIHRCNGWHRCAHDPCVNLCWLRCWFGLKNLGKLFTAAGAPYTRYWRLWIYRRHRAAFHIDIFRLKKV